MAVLTDLHVGAPHIDLAKLAAVVEATNAVEPELILLAGDYVIHGVKGGTFVPPEAMAPFLANLTADHGVFAVLGNHDWWYDGPAVRRAFEASGIEVLDNEAVWLSAEVWVAGLGDATTRHADLDAVYAAMPVRAPTLLVTHNPDIFPKVTGPIDLTIAGHTHGGQVWLPLLGRLVVPSGFGDRYAIGHVVEDGRHLFVSPGLGTSILPVRFGVPPEISVLELSPR